MSSVKPSEIEAYSPFLACPQCGGKLTPGPETVLVCRGCGSNFPLYHGVPSFSDQTVYWGEEFDRLEMQRINQTAESDGWRSAVQTLVAPKAPARARYITDFFRADWRFLFPLQSDWSVLDVGAGWGSLSASLAQLVAHVVSLESTLERVQFIRIRSGQDETRNIHPVHGDLSKPPLAPESFNLVTLNGVLEWLGWADTTRNTRKVQLGLLRNVHRLLARDGYLYVGIENRFGISYWLGAMDHSYLKYTSLLPRPLAHLVTKFKRGHTYRTYTYSPFGYRRLLEEAGFGDIEFYGVMPTYSRPIHYWPLEDGAPVQRFAEVLLSEKPNALGWKARLAQNLIRRLPLSWIARGAWWFAPHVLIVARKKESTS